MKKMLLMQLVALLLLAKMTTAQFYPKCEEYKHFSLYKKNDTIHYHVYLPNKQKEPEGLLLFIQGSGPAPMFQIREENGAQTIQSQVPFDLDRIPDNFAFVIVSKKGLPFSTTDNNFSAPLSFYENEGLDYRVWQYNEVLNHITQQQFKHLKKVIAIGHSEGSDVVAKLGTINRQLTHIGFWSGGGHTQYYDFALMIRKEVSEGKIDEVMAKQQMDSLMAQISDIEADPNSVTKLWQGNTYRRWSHFSEPSLGHLLKINIPVFVAFGAKDVSVPAESALIIPVEFARHKKTNLRFRLYPDYDHSFNKVPTNEHENWEAHWMDVFEEFMSWTNQ